MCSQAKQRLLIVIALVGLAIIFYIAPVKAVTSQPILHPDVFILEDDGTLAAKASTYNADFLTRKFYEKYPDKDVYDFIGFHLTTSAANFEYAKSLS